MTTLDDKQSFLDAIAANYEKPLPEKKVEVISVDVDPKKLSEVTVKPKRKPRTTTSKVNSNPEPTTGPKVEVPYVEPLSHSEFLEAIRNAGVRNGKRDFNLVRSDEQAIIHRYCNYDYGQPFGTQLDNALRKARSALKPSGPMRLSVAPSVAGWIKGCPDPKERQRADVTGRIRASIQASCDYQKIINFAKDNLEIKNAENFLQLEQLKLKKYHQELENLG